MREEHHTLHPEREEVTRAVAHLAQATREVAAVFRRLRKIQLPPPLHGHLCELCFDAPAVHLYPAPWGGEMGVCENCREPEGRTDGHG